WLIAAGGIWLVAELLDPHVQVDGFGRAMIVAAVVGFLNIIVRPILFLLTLPITFLTLGLFLIVINAVVINIAAWLLEGFEVESFGWAIIAAALISAFNMIVDNFTNSGRPARR
ncbi:MAG: phage holin family protein, partial [Planctomycetota bacterium]